MLNTVEKIIFLQGNNISFPILKTIWITKIQSYNAVFSQYKILLKECKFSNFLKNADKLRTRGAKQKR